MATLNAGDAVPRPGTPCPDGCMTGWPHNRKPELLAINEDGEVSCPACWECFGIIPVARNFTETTEG